LPFFEGVEVVRKSCDSLSKVMLCVEGVDSFDEVILEAKAVDPFEGVRFVDIFKLFPVAY
jgi:uncharacterized protein YabN with tetrapyrrole methylase and pyrophosphatase domain